MAGRPRRPSKRRTERGTFSESPLTSNLQWICMRILLVEDDPVIADGISGPRRGGGWSIMADGGGGCRRLRARVRFCSFRPRLAVAGHRGSQAPACRKSAVLVLILTAQDGVEDRCAVSTRGRRLPHQSRLRCLNSKRAVRALTPAAEPASLCIELGSLSYDQADRVVKISTADHRAVRAKSALEVLLLRVGGLSAGSALVDHLAAGAKRSRTTRSKSLHRLRKKPRAAGRESSPFAVWATAWKKPDAAAKSGAGKGRGEGGAHHNSLFGKSSIGCWRRCSSCGPSPSSSPTTSPITSPIRLMTKVLPRAARAVADGLGGAGEVKVSFPLRRGPVSPDQDDVLYFQATDLAGEVVVGDRRFRGSQRRAMSSRAKCSFAMA